MKTQKLLKVCPSLNYYKGVITKIRESDILWQIKSRDPVQAAASILQEASLIEASPSANSILSIFKTLSIDIVNEPYLLVPVYNKVELCITLKRSDIAIHFSKKAVELLAEFDLRRIEYMRKVSKGNLVYCVRCDSCLADIISSITRDALCIDCYKKTHNFGSRCRRTFTAFRQIACSECNNTLARIFCRTCKDPFCFTCFIRIHRLGGIRGCSGECGFKECCQWETGSNLMCPRYQKLQEYLLLSKKVPVNVLQRHIKEEWIKSFKKITECNKKKNKQNVQSSEEYINRNSETKLVKSLSAWNMEEVLENKNSINNTLLALPHEYGTSHLTLREKVAESFENKIHCLSNSHFNLVESISNDLGELNDDLNDINNKSLKSNGLSLKFALFSNKDCKDKINYKTYKSIKKTHSSIKNSKNKNTEKHVEIGCKSHQTSKLKVINQTMYKNRLKLHNISITNSKQLDNDAKIKSDIYFLFLEKFSHLLKSKVYSNNNVQDRYSIYDLGNQISNMKDYYQNISNNERVSSTKTVFKKPQRKDIFNKFQYKCYEPSKHLASKNITNLKYKTEPKQSLNSFNQMRANKILEFNTKPRHNSLVYNPKIKKKTVKKNQLGSDMKTNIFIFAKNDIEFDISDKESKFHKRPGSVFDDIPKRTTQWNYNDLYNTELEEKCNYNINKERAWVLECPWQTELKEINNGFSQQYENEKNSVFEFQKSLNQTPNLGNSSKKLSWWTTNNQSKFEYDGKVSKDSSVGTEKGKTESETDKSHITNNVAKLVLSPINCVTHYLDIADSAIDSSWESIRPPTTPCVWNSNKKAGHTPFARGVFEDLSNFSFSDTEFTEEDVVQDDNYPQTLNFCDFSIPRKLNPSKQAFSKDLYRDMNNNIDIRYDEDADYLEKCLDIQSKKPDKKQISSDSIKLMDNLQESIPSSRYFSYFSKNQDNNFSESNHSSVDRILSENNNILQDENDEKTTILESTKSSTSDTETNCDANIVEKLSLEVREALKKLNTQSKQRLETFRQTSLINVSEAGIPKKYFDNETMDMIFKCRPEVTNKNFNGAEILARKVNEKLIERQVKKDNIKTSFLKAELFYVMTVLRIFFKNNIKPRNATIFLSEIDFPSSSAQRLDTDLKTHDTRPWARCFTALKASDTICNDQLEILLQGIITEQVWSTHNCIQLLEILKSPKELGSKLTKEETINLYRYTIAVQLCYKFSSIINGNLYNHIVDYIYCIYVNPLQYDESLENLLIELQPMDNKHMLSGEYVNLLKQANTQQFTEEDLKQNDEFLKYLNRYEKPISELNIRAIPIKNKTCNLPIQNHLIDLIAYVTCSINPIDWAEFYCPSTEEFYSHSAAKLRCQPGLADYELIRLIENNTGETSLERRDILLGLTGIGLYDTPLSLRLELRNEMGPYIFDFASCTMNPEQTENQALITSRAKAYIKVGIGSKSH